MGARGDRDDHWHNWLKGNDAGMMDEPPIQLFIKGKNE
jgi:hypothetical protein